MKRTISIAIHGGASRINEITREHADEIRAALKEALSKGYQLLQQKDSALNAVEVAVKVLEDCPWFNAGKGSAITEKKTIEMHACISDGKTLGTGAVASVSRVRNPISLAKSILLDGRSCLLCDEGAEEFAREMQLPMEEEAYFHTEHIHRLFEQKVNKTGPFGHGTVGAVALDSEGNLAAATSTGGLMNAASRRVSDSAVNGASTYAHNETCAICCTGDGEIFIRTVLAKSISDRMKYNSCSLDQAVRQAVQEDLSRFKAEVGIIGMDASGNHAMWFNTERMYRGWKNELGEFTGIYQEE